MTRSLRPICAAAALTASLLSADFLLGPPALYAQASGGSYTMRKQVIGAGEVSSAGSYRLTGTVAEVGAVESDTPRFRLVGGFHGRSGPVVDSIFCDGFEDTVCP
jgi:hypothetical protein